MIKNLLKILPILFLVYDNMFADVQSNHVYMLQMTHDKDRYQLGQFLKILKDSEGKYTINEIAQLDRNEWYLSESTVPSFGYTDAVYWFHLRLEGLDLHNEWILEIDYAPLDHISLFYRSSDGSWVKRHAGDHYAFRNRDLDFRTPVFTLSGEEINEIYLRVNSTGVVKLPATLWSSKAFAEQSNRSTLALGLYFGIMLVMVLYNLCIFASTRALSYLFYVIYISSFGLAMFALNGLGFQLIWPDRPDLNQFMVPALEALSLGTLAVFISSYLNTKRHTPRLHFILNILKIYALVTISAAFWGGYELAIKLVTLGVLIFVVYVFIVSSVSLRLGYRPAKYFLIAFSSLLVGTFLFALTSAGLIPSNFITNYALQIGSLMEVVLLSLGLADKMNLAQEKADATNRQLISDLQKREREQAKSHEEIKKLNQDLIEKELARTAFFHNTSHELRTPLNGIIGFVELLKQPSSGLAAKAISQVSKIGMLADSLKNQVNTILDLAKFRKGELRLNVTAFSMNELVEEVKVLADGLSYRYPNTKFTLIYRQTDDRRFVFDREKLVVVIRNILSNAFKFRSIDRTNEVTLDIDFSEHNELMLKFQDTGIGIPEKQIDSIFLEFHQIADDARRAYEGTGIGLSMAKSVIELAQGKLKVRSKEGIGTTFQVQIPPQDQCVVEGEAVFEASSAESVGKDNNDNLSAIEVTQQVNEKLQMPLNRSDTNDYKIVLIDDNSINCEVVSEILQAQNYEVDCALGGREGLDMIRENKPDLILLDLMMPEVSGEDVLRELKEDSELNQIPVIILTARASQDDRHNSLNLGADDYLAKPIVTEEMLLRVKNIVARLDLVRSQSKQETLAKNLAAAQKFYISMQNLSSQLRGVEISSHYLSAEIAGGDWLGVKYDESNELLYAVIGDVTGHGMVSALLTVATAGAMNGCLHMMGMQPKLSPLDGLHRLAQSVNRVVYDLGQIIDRCMTMCFICIDVQKGQLAYINAGHNAIYLVRSGRVKPILEGSLPLGMSGESRFGQTTLDLEEGDMVFLYTDGLIENVGPDGQCLALRTIEKILKSGASPEHTKTKILEQGSMIWKHEEPEDDCSFLIIQWRGMARERKTA